VVAPLFMYSFLPGGGAATRNTVTHAGQTHGKEEVTLAPV